MDFEQLKLEMDKMNLTPKERDHLLLLVRRKLREHGQSGDFVNFDVLGDPNIRLKDSLELM